MEVADHRIRAPTVVIQCPVTEGDRRTAMAEGANPELQIPAGTTLLFFLALGVLLVLAAVVPHHLSERRVGKRQDDLLKQLKGTTDRELVRLYLQGIRYPGDVRGFTRGLIALLVVVLIGVAMAVALVSSADDSPDLRKTIVTSLTTVLATLAGFYFGARSNSPPGGPPADPDPTENRRSSHEDKGDGAGAGRASGTTG
jgi:hypothetical protein